MITQSTALRYFEHENPMGKVLEFDKGTKLTVTGVCEDAPSNSHFHYDMILPIQFWNVLFFRNMALKCSVSGK